MTELTTRIERLERIDRELSEMYAEELQPRDSTGRYQCNVSLWYFLAFAIAYVRITIQKTREAL